jgi:rod shape-determining protein MreC
MARTLRRIGLGALVIAGVALFALWRVDNPRVERFRMAAADVAAPSFDFIARPLADLADLARDWERFRAVDRQNRELRREIERLRAWREAAQELERENARLRALNHVRLSPRLAFATGEVLADARSPFGRSVLVNIGSRDGVETGAAAVDGAGLVGRVVGVGERVSRVLLLTDYDSRIPVKILPSGHRAILAGDATAAPSLAFFATGDAIKVGDRVVTSGDDGVLPPDLPVGVVAAVGDRAARVSLSADHARLEFLRVVRWSREAPLDAPVDLILPPEGAPAAGPVQAPAGGTAGPAARGAG